VGPILNVPSHRDDARNFRALFTLLNRPRAPQRAVASATFNTLLHRWAAHWEGAEARLPHRSAIESIIDAMPARLESGWSIRDMAKAAHMSERTFRDAFHSVTGQSPKGCFDRLRLSMAGELLKLGTLNVSEIAYRLGFSSPFHFSKAFKTFSGTPPSSLLPKPAARFRHE
jgi:transcriptional regulator GlxA family with amidase domain